MAMRCSEGHWYEPERSGRLGRCPQCATQTRNRTPVSDEDVLAILDLPSDVDLAESAEGASAEKDAQKSHSDSSILRRKKVCPLCAHEASYSFDHCPRCGAPLEIASIALR